MSILSSVENAVDRFVVNKSIAVINKVEDDAIYKIGVIVSNHIKNKFGFDVKVYDMTGVNIMCEWLEETTSKREGYYDNKEGIVKLAANTYVYYCIGFNNRNIPVPPSQYVHNKLRNNLDTLSSVYIFGKKSYRYYNQLMRKMNGSNNNDKLLLYNVSGTGVNEYFKSILTDLHQRDINTLFYEDNVKERISHHIDKFLSSKDIYNSRDLIYKTGIMMYGEPGTGKTSLASAIATKYKFNLININMETFADLDTMFFTESINADNKMYIVLMEDIDCIFKSLNRESKDISIEEKKIVNKLQQLLDGTSSPSNVIFIATTNHIDQLDDSILRAGRFDLKIEVGPIGKDKAAEMCSSFGLDKIRVKKVIDSVESFPVNQSHLQELILENVKDMINS